MSFPFPIIQPRVFLPLSYVYRGTADRTASSNINYTNLNFGPASYDRLIVMAISTMGSGNGRHVDPTSTIGGQRILGSVTGIGNNTNVAIVWARVTSGTTGGANIKFTGSGFARQARTVYYTVYGADANAFVGDWKGGGSNSRTTTGTVPESSVIIAATVGDQNTPTTGGWSGTTGITRDRTYRDGTDGASNASGLKVTSGTYTATFSEARAIVSVAFVPINSVQTFLNSRLSLLMHMDGSNLSSSFPDSSPFNHTTSPVGSTRVSTTSSVFGGASARFSAAADAISITDHSSLRMGTGNFTVDFWCNLPNGRWGALFDKGFTNSGALLIEIHEDNYLRIYLNGSLILGSETYFTPGVWTHYALVRINQTVMLFKNGVFDGWGTSSANLFNTSPLRIGEGGGAGSHVRYIDEFRILKGYAAWGGNFIPPTSPY